MYTAHYIEINFLSGDEGRKAFEESQLTAHGFQGVQVRHH